MISRILFFCALFFVTGVWAETRSSSPKIQQSNNPSLQSSRPNILVIQTDQQSSWTLSCYGGTLVDTPHIDRLAKEGARLDNFYSNCAICTPSRGCFQTGRYPHANGAVHNSYPLNDDEVTLGRLFRDQGYDTGYLGKWHLAGKERSHMHPDKNGVKRWSCVLPNQYAYGYEDTPYMIEHWHGKKITGTLDNPIFGEANFIGDWKDFMTRSFDFGKSVGDENSYPTDYLCDRAMEYMAEKRDAPFFLFLSIPDPHNPFHGREPYESMYKPEDMTIPENFSQRENLPQWAAVYNRFSSNGFDKDRTEWPDGAMDAETHLRNMKSKYCGMVKHIDDCVGEIYASLEQQGILDDTIVIFTTDHGDYMGEHGIAGKPCVYEGVYRIPFLIRYPEKVKQGLVVNHHVSTVDFMSTICALAGVRTSGREQGHNAAPLFQRKKVDWDDVAFQHYMPNPKTPEIAPDRAGIFTPQYHLCYVYSGMPGVEHVLFDRRKDPLEMNNLFYDPEYRGTIDKLTAQILKQRESIDAPEVEWLKKCPQF
jgi:arylsulfatase A-like enzyme